MNSKEQAFKERMAKKQEKLDEAEAQKADELRQDYLKRTGRKELKP